MAEITLVSPPLDLQIISSLHKTVIQILPLGPSLRSLFHLSEGREDRPFLELPDPSNVHDSSNTVVEDGLLPLSPLHGRNRTSRFRIFTALFLAQERTGECKRIVSDYSIIAQVNDMVSDYDARYDARYRYIV